jgi:hypothetical protein
MGAKGGLAPLDQDLATLYIFYVIHGIPHRAVAYIGGGIVGYYPLSPKCFKKT